MAVTLFICKSGSSYISATAPNFRKFSGLATSARLVSDMLNLNNINSVIEIADDNNDIDRLVTLHKPKYCIIEAYWVVPEKFEVLTKLHPDVTWIIRIHSEAAFWAIEGISLDWTYGYLQYSQVLLSPNSINLQNDLLGIGIPKDKLLYLPNYYPVALYKDSPPVAATSDVWKVGCFGAVRPLKNQLIQAFAAIRYANLKDRTLEFHINSNRIEGGGEPVLKNLRGLFMNNTRHTLVEHEWMPHEDFIKLIATLDIGLQVSFTESFNIVTADFVSQNKPVVTSKEVPFVAKPFYADCTNGTDIIKAIFRAEVLNKRGVFLNKYLLQEQSLKAEQIWVSQFDPIFSLE